MLHLDYVQVAKYGKKNARKKVLAKLLGNVFMVCIFVLRYLLLFFMGFLVLGRRTATCIGWPFFCA